MHHTIKTTLLCLCLSLLHISCTVQDPQWLNSTPSDNLWTAVQSSFSLPGYEDHPKVQKQIAWYQLHKIALEHTLLRAKPYLYFIHQATQQHQLPGELVLMPIIESAYSPFAYSWAGATGLWQMMPGTASGMRLKINWWVDERRDIIQSTHAALNYTAYLKDFFKNNWLLAIAAYDSGAGRVQSATQAQHSTDFWKLKLPKETQNYIPKILALKAIVSRPEHYQIKLPYIKNEPYFKAGRMQAPIDLQHASKLAGISTTEMRLLNPSFRRWSTLPKGNYNLLLPAKNYHQFIHNLHRLNVKNIHKQLKKHTIQPNETLSVIAHQHNLSTRRLSEINQLQSQHIRIGQTLWVPKNGILKFPGFTLKQTLKISADKAPGPQRYVHVCRQHETLASIAKTFNVNLKELTFWNQFKSTHQPHVGDKILIWKPPRIKSGTNFYIVKRGDTLSDICHRFKCSLSSLKRYNTLPAQNLLRIGQVLRIR